MTGPPVLGALVLLLAAAACTSPQQDGTAQSDGSGETDVRGRLAVVDDAGNIVTMDDDGANRVEITSDGDSVRYSQPIWSKRSRTLAWAEGDGSRTSVGIAKGDGTGRESVDVDGFPFYLHWSPDGERVGYLQNGTDGSIDFGMVDVGEGSAGVNDSGVPYYFSWSPDGKAIVVHVGGTRLEIFDEAADPTSVGESTSNFFAPSWTDAGIFYVDQTGPALRVSDGSVRSLLAPSSGFVSINPSPAGTWVAVHVTAGEQPGLTVGLSSQEQATANAITIVDVENGEVDSVVDRLTVGSFWSPDGQKLAVLALSDQEGSVDVVVWEGGTTTELGSAELNRSFAAEVLPFFDQYAQSWQIWDPASTRFVLPASFDGDSGIWVFAADGSNPRKVTEGTWAAWSHN